MSSAPPAVEEFGPYRLTHLLGKGGMASVYRAVRSGPMGFAKEVAIKRLHESLSDNESILKGLINEARIGGQLKHQNIVEIYEFNKVNDLYYLSMEFVDGWTLDRILKLARQFRMPLPPAVVLEIGRQICDALDYAHKLQSLDGQAVRLVHRDLKPANIILSRLGVTKLMDFGIAKADTNLFHTTMVDVTKGTPHYMSPEQVAGAKDLTASSDLFALGAVLYELTTGRVLFVGDSLPTVLFNVVKAEVAPQIRDADVLIPGIAPILEGLLRKDPKARTLEASVVGVALESLHSARYATGITPRQYLYTLRERLVAGGTVQATVGDKELAVADETRSAVEAAGDPEFATLFAPVPRDEPAQNEALAEARRMADAEIGAIGKVFAGTGALQVDTFGATKEAIGSLIDEASTPRARQLGPDEGFAQHGGTDTHPNRKVTRQGPASTRKMPRKGAVVWTTPLRAAVALLSLLLLSTLVWVVMELRSSSAPDAALPDVVLTAPDLGLDELTALASVDPRPAPATRIGPRPVVRPEPTDQITPEPALAALTPGEPAAGFPSATPAAPTSLEPPAPTPAVVVADPRPARVGVGWVSIKTSNPYSRVVIDGIDTGKTTPLMRFELPAGPHRLVLEAVEVTKKSGAMMFTVEPGQTIKVGHYDFLSESWSE